MDGVSEVPGTKGVGHRRDRDLDGTNPVMHRL